MTGFANQHQRYERWSGKLNRGWWTWFAIVRMGLRLANKDSQSRALLYMGLSFVASVCGFFYVLNLVEQFINKPATEELAGFIESTLGFVKFALGLDLSQMRRIEELRPVIWRAVFMLSVNIQLFWVALTVSRVGPGLIADDIKTRALPIYFAKPITPLTYLMGKWLVVATYIGLLVLLPNLVALLFAVLITGGLDTWNQTMLLAGQLIAAGSLIMVFGGLLMLALSSLSSDKRYVSVGWFAVCVLPIVAQAVLVKNLPEDRLRGLLGCISLHDNLRAMTEWIFGLRSALEASGLGHEQFAKALLRNIDPVYPALVLGGLTVLCAAVCYRRVVRFSRSAANL